MLILHAKGQTGNKFFTYLTYLGDSLETGEQLVVLSPDITLRYYPNLVESKLIKFPFYSHFISDVIGYKNNIKILYLLFGNKYIVKFFELFFKIVPNVDFLSVPTTYNRSRNHTKHTIKIKKAFAPNYQLIRSVDNVFYSIRKTHQIVCGVHLRFGDYKTYQGGKYYFSKKQYHSKMLEFQSLFQDEKVAFFISSNEKIDLSLFNECDCFIIPESNVPKDLYGLSLTDYIIGPPSTFSGWGSYYGDVPLYFIEDIETKIKMDSFKHIIDIWT